MADAERPSRVVSLDHARRAGGEELTGASPEVLRRLSALEAQVEHALASARPRDDPADLVGGVLDDALGAYSDLRRWWSERTGGARSSGGELARRILFRLWWRVEVEGLERVPSAGRVLVVVHRATPLIPYATFMAAEAFVSPKRAAIPCVEPALLRAPLLGAMLAALGGRPATAREVEGILGRDALAVVAPESPRAIGKSWAARYRLGPLTRVALLRAAIATGAPIVPLAAIGSEETQPSLARLPALGRVLGLPAFPLALSPIPLPVKWVLHVGEPLEVAARWPPATARDPLALRTLRIEVRERLARLLREGQRRRHGGGSR